MGYITTISIKDEDVRDLKRWGLSPTEVLRWATNIIRLAQDPKNSSITIKANNIRDQIRESGGRSHA